METTDGNDVRRAGAKARVAALRALIRRDGVVRPVRHLVRVIRAEGPRGAWRRARGFFAAAAPESGQRLDGGDCLFVAGCAGGSRVYRCDNQAEQLRLAGQAADVVAYPAVDPMPYAGAYRCFVLQRVPFSKNIAAFIAAAKQNGATVVFDADDLLVHERWLEELGPHVTDDATERAWAIDQMQRTARTIERCDMVLCSTPALRDFVEQTFPGIDVHVTRNVASEAQVRAAEAAITQTEPHDGVHIGYFCGTPTHRTDLARIVGVLQEVLHTLPEVMLDLVGAIDRPNGLAAFGDRVRTRPRLDAVEFVRALRAVDIHLAPLGDGAFNAAKSEIKWLEAGLVARPTVASATGAYAAVIRDHKNGLLCTTHADWQAALLELAGDTALRERIGAQARSDVLATSTTRAAHDVLVGVCS